MEQIGGKRAWAEFIKTGRVDDYLRYCELCGERGVLLRTNGK